MVLGCSTRPVRRSRCRIGTGPRLTHTSLTLPPVSDRAIGRNAAPCAGVWVDGRVGGQHACLRYPILVLTGPSGSGKRLLRQQLTSEYDSFVVCPSHTTRPRHDEEVDGQDYCFVDVAEFGEIVEAGGFIQTCRLQDYLFGWCLCRPRWLLGRSGMRCVNSLSPSEGRQPISASPR